MLEGLSAISAMQKQALVFFAPLQLLAQGLYLGMGDDWWKFGHLIEERLIRTEVIDISLKLFVGISCPHLNIINNKNIRIYH
jgi:hypothetical protein